VSDPLQQITDLLNTHEQYWAKRLHSHHNPPQRNDYLILFARRDADIIYNLVLMGDYGITWKPFKIQDTPTYCSIDITDPNTAAQQLMIIADAFANNQLSLDAEEGEGTGQHLLE
jgi:hypothetical protein